MILKKKKTLSPLEKIVYTTQKKVNQWDKQRKHWKTRFYITVVLPVLLVAMTVKAVKTYVRIKLWEIGTKASSPLEKPEEKSEEKQAN